VCGCVSAPTVKPGPSCAGSENVRHVQTHLKKSVRLYQLQADPTMAWVSSGMTKLWWSCT
jgi:hypothetical protein